LPRSMLLLPGIQRIPHSIPILLKTIPEDLGKIFWYLRWWE